MKKSLIALAVLGTFAGGVAAQSSMTISGLLDVSLIHTSTTPAPAQAWKVAAGNNNRLIFSGVEDLGGGNTATFGLQHRFEPNSGMLEKAGARPFWQGESRVGLRSNDWGWLRIGRGLTPVQEPNGKFEPFGVATVAHTQDYLTAYYKAVDDTTKALNAAGVSDAFVGGEGRWDGAVFYETPNWSGLAVRGAIQKSDRDEPSQPVSASLTYDQGPTSAMVGVERNNRGTRNIQIAGLHNFGPVKVMGSWAVNDPVGALKITGMGAGLHVPVGDFLIRAGLAQAKSNGAGTVSAKKMGLGGLYNLSPRTSVYSDIARSNGLLSRTNTTAMDLGIASKF
ncbi:porin [Leptothrix discophora]|uniref:Porin n=1 Tax=Leptothrix discophora TaxID=89 RepID=A0ABT9G2Z2_LEPDI|nr:porin [Leptothrix discophora]MDP4300822.1 porin [Leptothrix discophora]